MLEILGKAYLVLNSITVLWLVAVVWRLLDRVKKIENPPKPCSHGHIDWDECPVCGH